MMRPGYVRLTVASGFALLLASGLAALDAGAVAAQPPPQAPPHDSRYECSADVDCFHTGCLGQICASADVATSCEFRCEHGCYAQASCECFGPRCRFRHDAALQRCLNACRQGQAFLRPDPDRSLPGTAALQ